jgi:ABC-type microcin C transport system duplicated ATPase subunit YejF
MTVLEIIGEGLYLQGGFSNADIKEKVADWLAAGGASTGSYVALLPRVFRRATPAYRHRPALVLNPKFVVCDEPISAWMSRFKPRW